MIVQLPGLVDPHVHLREPGATHKEDFSSGTAAALAGGFTAVLAMPNTDPPLTDRRSFQQALSKARAKARCDYGLFLGATETNAQSAPALAGSAIGLKLYLDQTYGPLQLHGLGALLRHAAAWPARRPLCAHAEGRNLAALLLMASIYNRPVHVCHVSRRDELLLIRLAKERGLPVTCEVTPHHLMLNETDLPHLGEGPGRVSPSLGTPADQAALWENLDVVDCFASDHAPHTYAEKQAASPPPGYPGLETTLGLLLTAVGEGRLPMETLIEKCWHNPRMIFNLPEQEETFIEIDRKARWEVRGEELLSKCGWTPFEGRRLQGRVCRVTLRGRLVYEHGKVLAQPGEGLDLSSATQV